MHVKVQHQVKLSSTPALNKIKKLYNHASDHSYKKRVIPTRYCIMEKHRRYYDMVVLKRESIYGNSYGC